VILQSSSGKIGIILSGRDSSGCSIIQGISLGKKSSFSVIVIDLLKISSGRTTSLRYILYNISIFVESMGAAILGYSRHVTKDAMSYSLEDISSCDISSPEAIVCLIVRLIIYPFRDSHSREEC
jgi:hypothetical protein